MTLYLLDTNIVSDLMSDRFGRVGRRLQDVGSDEVCTSIIVAAELRYGAMKKASARVTRRVDDVLGYLAVRDLEAPFDETYGRFRTDLEGRGLSLDTNDLIIAAHALTLGCTLVSHDAAFARVPGLTVEDWLD